MAPATHEQGKGSPYGKVNRAIAGNSERVRTIRKRREVFGTRKGDSQLVIDYTAALLSLNEFPMTLTDDSAIAAAAMTGDNTSPKVG